MNRIFTRIILLPFSDMEQEISTEPEIVKESVFVKCKTFDMVPYEKSLMFGKTHLLADASLTHGREYNTRWSADWTFVHSSKQVGLSLVEAKKALNPHIFSSSVHQPLPSFGLCGMNVNVERVELKTKEGMKQFIEVCFTSFNLDSRFCH